MITLLVCIYRHRGRSEWDQVLTRLKVQLLRDPELFAFVWILAILRCSTPMSHSTHYQPASLSCCCTMNFSIFRFNLLCFLSGLAFSGCIFSVTRRRHNHTAHCGPLLLPLFSTSSQVSDFARESVLIALNWSQPQNCLTSSLGLNDISSTAFDYTSIHCRA